MPIQTSRDVITSRTEGKKHAVAMGFPLRDVIGITTATSELARNIIQHSKSAGRIVFFECNANGKKGIGILADDSGIGISDTKSIMQQSNRVMGGGLYGTQKLANEFLIDSKPGFGTRVQFIKWSN